MSDLTEDHVNAFFHDGDAGRYEGGPSSDAASLTPVAFDDVGEDEVTPGPSLEQILRRERYKRLVTRLVGGLGAASVLLFALRVTRSREDDAAVSTDRVARVTEPAPSRLVAVPAAHSEVPLPAVQAEVKADVAPAPVAEALPVAAPAEPTSAAPAIAIPHPSAAALARAADVPHRTASNKAGSAAEPSTEYHAPLRPAVVTLASRGSSTGSHAPPTVSFPD